MDLILNSDTELPQAKRFWQKVSDDLKNGYRIEGEHPHYMDIIRVFTKVEQNVYPSTSGESKPTPEVSRLWGRPEFGGGLEQKQQTLL